MKKYVEQIVRELAHAAAMMSGDHDDRLGEAISRAGRIFVAGAGRSGLMMKAFAMRLMHLGYSAHVVGESVTPGIAEGDLLIIGSGSGETRSLIGMLEKAKTYRATIAVVTTQPSSSISLRSDIVIVLPGATKDHSSGLELTAQPMGSLFEQTLLLYLDAAILHLMELQGQNSGKMYGRHANLE
ncbi:6-phospho-3-hexuloisomerase [Paenibacillus chartarius]|uniref:6-phospho-3-hexuloisomerase n=1 Tax=Paenibacillus chartarius TaxID=747481 RepID=A0ABV6DJ59_9BACL